MIRVLTLCCLLLTLVSCSKPPADNNQKTFKIGYMICNSEQETLERFVPFTRFLSEKMGVKFEPVAIDTINFTREIENLDFVHTNSLLYIILNRFNGVEVLAAERKGSLGRLSKGVIIVRADSKIKSIADLQGKSMVFGPMLAPTGFMSQVDLLQSNGIDPEQDLAFYTIPTGSFKHEKVLYGVLFEKFDAGALPIDDLETMAADNRIDPADFRIIGEGPAIPYCNFAVTQKIDDAMAEKFKKLLLSIKKDDTVEIDGERIRVLDRALVQGYEEIVDQDFDEIREMARRTNMPPFQKF